MTGQHFENQLSEIRDYARLLTTGVTSLDRIKVYFCGQPEAGKTTLSRALANGPLIMPDETNPLKLRTRGIDVSQVKLSDGSECSFWDFAGQGDYVIHHDLFMSHEASVFFIIIDVRQSEVDRHRHSTYWLQYIVTQCPHGAKPSVLLLASHVDEVVSTAGGNAGTLSLSLLSLFSNLSAVFGAAVRFIREEITEINCRDRQSSALSEVKQAISEARRTYREQTGSHAPVICKQMIGILNHLRETNRTRFLSWSQFEESMSVISTDASLLKLAIKYLHNIGDVFYRDRGPLSDIIIVDLPWLCHEVLGWLFCPMDMLTAHNMVRMIRFRILSEAGPVPHNDIPVKNMFENTSIRTLDVLQSFELCLGCEIDKDTSYIFPTLLRNKPSTELWTPNAFFDIHVGVKFTCSSATTMIPPGFFPRLQIVARQDIGPPFTKETSHMIWENGFICQDDSSQVRVKLTPDSRSIIAHIRGTETANDSRRLLLQFIDIVDRVCQRSAGLNFDVHLLNTPDLIAYAVNPSSTPLSALIEARSQGSAMVASSPEVRIRVCDLIALEKESCMLNINERHMSACINSPRYSLPVDR